MEIPCFLIDNILIGEKLNWSSVKVKAVKDRETEEASWKTVEYIQKTSWSFIIQQDPVAEMVELASKSDWSTIHQVAEFRELRWTSSNQCCAVLADFEYE